MDHHYSEIVQQIEYSIDYLNDTITKGGDLQFALTQLEHALQQFFEYSRKRKALSVLQK